MTDKTGVLLKPYKLTTPDVIYNIESVGIFGNHHATALPVFKIIPEVCNCYLSEQGVAFAKNRGFIVESLGETNVN